MAVTGKWFTNGVKQAVTDVNWTADTIKVTLHSSALTPDQDAMEFFSAVGSELPTGNGYTAGGVTLAGKSVTVNTATNRVQLKASNAVWTASAGAALTARYAVLRKDTDSAATSPVLGWLDFGVDVTAT